MSRVAPNRPYAGIGQLMQDARESVKKHGVAFTQAQMAKALKLKTRTQIGRWETGVVLCPHHRLTEYLGELIKLGFSEDLAEQIFEKAYPDRTFQLGRSSEQEKKRVITRNLDAFEAISRARHLIDERTKLDLATATDMLEYAIECDPSCAMAYALSSYTTMLRLHYEWISPNVFQANGLRPAQKALELDSDLAWSHIAMGFVKLRLKFIGEAIECFEKAIELEGDSPFAHTGYGVALCYSGQGEKALEQIDIAEKLNPCVPQRILF